LALDVYPGILQILIPNLKSSVYNFIFYMVHLIFGTKLIVITALIDNIKCNKLDYKKIAENWIYHVLPQRGRIIGHVIR